MFTHRRCVYIKCLHACIYKYVTRVYTQCVYVYIYTHMQSMYLFRRVYIAYARGVARVKPGRLRSRQCSMSSSTWFRP